MVKFFAVLLVVFAASCASQPPLFVGTGIIDGKPVELQTQIYLKSEGPVKAMGWSLIVAGEEMGVLYLDGEAVDGKQELLPLKTKYGIFDGISETNRSTTYSIKFNMTLNDEYIGTVVGSLN